METQIWRKRGQAGFRLVSGHSVFIPRLGLLITFVRATIPQTLHAAILFSCLCFYDFPKRTAPKIHKIWHLVNLINVLQPFAKKDENSKKDGWCFPPGSLWDLDGPICRTWMLYAGSVLSFSVTIRIPPPCPSWVWAVIWWGCSPYPAHLPHPNKNIWLQWHQPHRAYEIFAADFTPMEIFASTIE